MTDQEEQFIHFASSIDKLNSAWQILKEIKQHKGHPLVAPAFQFALVEYSKPYTVSYGTELDAKGKPERKYLLDEKHIPINHRALHDRLLISRKRIHAHDDLSVKEARLYVKNTQQGKFVGTVQNVIHGTEELSNIDAIIDLIEKTLENMYVEEKRLEALLPPNS
jgi:hypothetical protein